MYVCTIYYNTNIYQFSSVAQSCLTLCDSMNCSTPGLPVHHQLPKSTQTNVHWVGDAIQPCNPLSPLLLLPSIFPSIRVFSNELALLIRWPKYWSFIFSISPSSEYYCWFILGLSGLISLLSKGLSRVFSSTIVWKHQFLVLNLLYGPTLISVDNYWKKTALTIRTFASKVMSDYQYL